MNNSRIKIFARIRPFDVENPLVENNEKNKNHIFVDEDHKRMHLRNEDKTNQMTSEYDKIFDDNSSQKDVFEPVMEYIDEFFSGYDCSILAYGQTGTGKTYTMSGKEWSADTLNKKRPEFDDTIIYKDTGIIPRATENIFQRILKTEKQSELENINGNVLHYDVYCSFMEIYKEKIYDLLAPDLNVYLSSSNKQFRNVSENSIKKDSININHKGNKKKSNKSPSRRTEIKNLWNCPKPDKSLPSLQIRQKVDGSVFVPGLTCRLVRSVAEMQKAFNEGAYHREVRDNTYNQHSSRSHTIFLITLRSTISKKDLNKEQEKNENVYVKNKTKKKFHESSINKIDEDNLLHGSRISRLSFIDLAGSEKWSIENKLSSDVKDYAKELAFINKSLSSLSHCIYSLTLSQNSHIPYRDSILTRILQSSLEGKGHTCFFMTLSPFVQYYEENVSTLRFADRIKCVISRPIIKKMNTINQDPMLIEQRNYYESQIHEMRKELDRLRNLLQLEMEKKKNEISENDSAFGLFEENKKLKEQLRHSEEMLKNERKSINELKSKMIPDNNTKSALVLSTEQRYGIDLLISKLQTEEAKLNEMLEAEIEAAKDSLKAHETSSRSINEDGSVLSLSNKIDEVNEPYQDVQTLINKENSLKKIFLINMTTNEKMQLQPNINRVQDRAITDKAKPKIIRDEVTILHNVDGKKSISNRTVKQESIVKSSISYCRNDLVVIPEPIRKSNTYQNRNFIKKIDNKSLLLPNISLKNEQDNIKEISVRKTEIAVANPNKITVLKHPIIQPKKSTSILITDEPLKSDKHSRLRRSDVKQAIYNLQK